MEHHVRIDDAGQTALPGVTASGDGQPTGTAESNVIRLPAADASNLLAQARPFEPDPPSSQGTCDRCGYRGAVYAGRYGGQRCAVCFGIQTGWMPRGEL